MKKSILLTIVLVAMWPGFAAAQVQGVLAICVGKVEAIATRPGSVYLKLDTMDKYFRLCSTDYKNYSITPESCADFKSTAYIAFTTGKTLMVYIKNALQASNNSYVCPENVIPANLDADVSYMRIY